MMGAVQEIWNASSVRSLDILRRTTSIEGEFSTRIATHAILLTNVLLSLGRYHVAQIGSDHPKTKEAQSHVALR